MPVSFEFLRGVVGLVGVGCAFMLGRTLAAVRKGWQKPTRIYGWVIRTAACMVAVVLRHGIDATAIVLWAVSAALCALGFWLTSRRRNEEDLVGAIFPDKQ
ncbi:MAG TPA: hypothetical protein VMU19_08530 [Bryobacteraceae bacterium]|nr:hypothetical protein [Bryobacteraceae bacterium]